jgi:AcrR family transcriptional regulator
MSISESNEKSVQGSVPPALSVAAVDGRTARKNSNRDAVVEAALQLFQAGAQDVKMEDIAEAAGVSVRSVYRYFGNVEEVLEAAMMANLSKYGQLFELDNIGRGTLSERIQNLVAARLNLITAAFPMITAVLRHRHADNAIGAQARWRLYHMYLQNTEMFGPEFSKMTPVESRQIAAAVDSLLSYYTVDSMLNRLGFDIEDAQAALVHGLELLLRPWQDQEPGANNIQLASRDQAQPPA